RPHRPPRQPATPKSIQQRAAKFAKLFPQKDVNKQFRGRFPALQRGTPHHFHNPSQPSPLASILLFSFFFQGATLLRPSLPGRETQAVFFPLGSRFFIAIRTKRKRLRRSDKDRQRISTAPYQSR